MIANKQLKKEINSYYRKIKKTLPCYNKVMKKMLDDLKFSIEAYLDENPNAEFQDIEKHFGTAEQISNDFSTVISEPQIKAYKRTKYIRIALLSVLSAILVFIGALTIIIYINNSRDTIYYYETSVTDLGWYDSSGKETI